MPKFRKLPVVVEAVQWFPGEKVEGVITNDSFSSSPYIETLEGAHIVSPGDYIITGIKGEKYPCKKEIFRLTYERVEGNTNYMLGLSSLAIMAYYAYGQVTDFKNFRGEPMPEFQALPEKIKEAWVAAVSSVLKEVDR